MATFTYLNGATNETYSLQAFSYISNQRIKKSIISTSNILGISAGAIAGAMAEENTAYDFVDEVLDAYAKSGFDPLVALETLPQAIAGGAIQVSMWMATHAGQLGTKRTHAEWQAYYAAAQSYQGVPSGWWLTPSGSAWRWTTTRWPARLPRTFSRSWWATVCGSRPLSSTSLRILPR